MSEEYDCGLGYFIKEAEEAEKEVTGPDVVKFMEKSPDKPFSFNSVKAQIEEKRKKSNPWNAFRESFNSTMEEFGIDIRLRSRDETWKEKQWQDLRNKSDLSHYRLDCFCKGKLPLSFSELSGGERLVASILVQMAIARLEKRSLLILLDEPDSHFHPSLAKKLVEFLTTAIQKEDELQVICTTHFPTTIASIPFNNPRVGLFQLEDGKMTRMNLEESSHRVDVVHHLTDGQLMVVPDFKLVFLEGKTDAPFYRACYKGLLKRGAIEKSPALQFCCMLNRDSAIKAGETVNTRRDGKGLAVVIVDRDYKEAPKGNNMFQLSRYSMENFLFDISALSALLSSTLVNGVVGEMNSAVAVGEAASMYVKICGTVCSDATNAVCRSRK